MAEPHQINYKSHAYVQTQGLRYQANPQVQDYKLHLGNYNLAANTNREEKEKIIMKQQIQLRHNIASNIK